MSAIFSAISTYFGYFNPRKAPFLFIATTASLCLSSVSAGIPVVAFVDDSRWLPVLVPLTLILLVAVVQTFRSRTPYKGEEYVQQMRISRSMGVSVAVLTIVLGARLDNEHWYWIFYTASLVQVPTFLLLAYIFRNEDKEYDRGNLVATTSMASLFLLVGVTAITAHTDPSRDTWTGDSIEHSKEFAERSVIATYIFLALWATCISKVILIIRKYVSFRILEPINSPTHETDPQQAD